MTAANEKLLPCPFCGGTNIDHKPSTGIYCATCEIWYGVMNASKASLVAAWNCRAQTAEAVDEAKEREAFEKWLDEQTEFRSVCDTVFALNAWLARARGGN